MKGDHRNNGGEHAYCIHHELLKVPVPRCKIVQTSMYVGGTKSMVLKATSHEMLKLVVDYL